MTRPMLATCVRPSHASLSSMEPTAPTFTPTQLGDTTLPAYTATGTDAKRSHLLYERVIPVVNNAL